MKGRVTTLSSEQKTTAGRVLALAAFGSTLIFIGMIYALSCGHDGIMVAAVSTIIGGIIAGAGGWTIGRVLK